MTTILDAAIARGGYIECAFGGDDFVIECPVEPHGRRYPCYIWAKHGRWHCEKCDEWGGVDEFCAFAKIDKAAVKPATAEQLDAIRAAYPVFEDIDSGCVGVPRAWADMVIAEARARYRRRSRGRTEGKQQDSSKVGVVSRLVDALRISLILVNQGKRGNPVYTSRSKLIEVYAGFDMDRGAEALRGAARLWDVRQKDGVGMQATWTIPLMTGSVAEFIPLPAAALHNLDDEPFLVLLTLHHLAEDLRRGLPDLRNRMLPVRYRFPTSVRDLARIVGGEYRRISGILDVLDDKGYFEKKTRTLTPDRARKKYKESGGLDAPDHVYGRMRLAHKDPRPLQGITPDEEDDEISEAIEPDPGPSPVEPAEESDGTG